MAPFCDLTCGRCTGAGGNDTSTSPAPAPGAPASCSNATSATAPPPAAPANASAGPTQLGVLSGNVAEYGKVGGVWVGKRGDGCSCLCSSPARLPCTAYRAPQPHPTQPLPPIQHPQVLGMSWLFMYAQRSGRLSSAPTNPIPWRGDDHLQDPVVGGWVAGCCAPAAAGAPKQL